MKTENENKKYFLKNDKIIDKFHIFLSLILVGNLSFSNSE